MTSFHPAPIVGRRKEAIVRVRLMPGTGQFTLNGRSMDSYFPNKVHQQLIREPLVTLDRDGQYDVIASLRGGGVTGQAGALRLAIARALIDLQAGGSPGPEEGRFPHSRPAGEGAQEVRPQEGTQGAPVLQALIRSTSGPLLRHGRRSRSREQ